MSDLLDWRGRQEFERSIVEQINSGDVAGARRNADAKVEEVADPTLSSAAAVISEKICIDDWDEILADFKEADVALKRRFGSDCGVIALDLVNRDRFLELRVERRFFAGPEPDVGSTLMQARDFYLKVAQRDKAWFQPLEERRVVRILGLEELVAIQRTPFPFGGPERKLEQERHDRRTTLAGLLIVLHYFEAVARTVDELGLTRPVPLFVGIDKVDWPMESGVYDFGPNARILLTPGSQTADERSVRGRLVERYGRRLADWGMETEQVVEDLTRTHRYGRRPAFWSLPAGVGSYFRLKTKLNDRSLREGMGIRGSKPIRRMNDHEFAALIKKVREGRAERAPRPPFPEAMELAATPHKIQPATEGAKDCLTSNSVNYQLSDFEMLAVQLPSPSLMPFRERIGSPITMTTGFIRRQAQRATLVAGQLAPHQFSIEKEGMRAISRDGEALTPWSSIQEIRVAEDRLFLIFSRDSAWIIPCRAFRDGAAFERFCAAARDRWTTAKQ